MAAILIYQPSPAYTEYDIDQGSISQIYPDETNAMTITVRKWGRDSNIDLTLKFTNASFSPKQSNHTTKLTAQQPSFITCQATRPFTS